MASAKSTITDLAAICEQCRVLGKKYTDTITEQVNKCTHDHGLLLAVAERLEYVLTEVHAQVQLVDAISARVNSRFTSFGEYASAAQSDQAVTATALETVFSELKATFINDLFGPELSGQSLFESVDADAVKELQTRLAELCNELLSLETQRGDIQSTLTQQGSPVKQQARVLLDHVPNDRMTLLRRRILDLAPALKQGQKERHNMLGLMQEIEGVCERVKQVQEERNGEKVKGETGGGGGGDGEKGGSDSPNSMVSSTSSSTSTLATGLSNEANKATEYVELLQQSHDKVIGTTTAVNALVTTYRSLYNDSVRCHDAVLAYSDSASQAVNTLTGIHTRAAAVYNDIAALIDELRNLTEWYQLFHTAYHELQHELLRRQDDNNWRYSIAVHYQRELKMQWDAEWQRRVQFFETRGRFLPPQLVASSGVTHSPVSYEIFPIDYNTVNTVPNPEAEASANARVSQFGNSSQTAGDTSISDNGNGNLARGSTTSPASPPPPQQQHEQLQQQQEYSHGGTAEEIAAAPLTPPSKPAAATKDSPDSPTPAVSVSAILNAPS